MPGLPGRWTLGGTVLYREPAEWLLCYLVLNTSRHSSAFTVPRAVQLLAAPRPYLAGRGLQNLGHGTGRSLWPSPATEGELESVMREILQHALDSAVPFFDTVGNLDGYEAVVRTRAQAQPGDVHANEELFCLCLIRGDLDGMAHAAQATAAAVHAEPGAWADEIGARVARIVDLASRDPDAARLLLHEQADQTRALLTQPARRRSNT